MHGFSPNKIGSEKIKEICKTLDYKQSSIIHRKKGLSDFATGREPNR